jgi:Domain of unknown function (DUF6398)
VAARRRTPASQPRSAGKPPRYTFFLNPYSDVRFTRCPQCGGRTVVRKLPLVIHVEPRHLIALNMSCRYCPQGDLLIAHQDELEGLLEAYFRHQDPQAVGNDYQVVGTMDRADWKRGLRGTPTLDDMLGNLHEFAAEVTFEPGSPVAGDEPGDEPLSAPEGPQRGAPRDASGPGRQKQESVPRRLRPLYEEIVARTDKVCREHLNEEYAELCRRLAAALARKRPSPLTRGRPAGWACGIAYAIGSVNFLFDKSQTPHHRATELCAFFGVSPATGSARASEIRALFGMYPFDPRWCLPGQMDENPYVWLITVDGIPADARYAPRQVQEEALRRGLIPYLPKTSMEW